ncbi:transposase, partial [Ruminococcus sp.]|uniref:transposase n=1 Tax=Ruminococcus sp. TaxID=41978 RepID=UPI003AB3126B
MSIISLWGKVLQLYYSTSLLSNANVTGMEDIQRLFRETIAEFLEGSLDAEPEKTLGYGRYDHTARTESGTTNSRNGHSRKTLKTRKRAVRKVKQT